MNRDPNANLKRSVCSECSTTIWVPRDEPQTRFVCTDCHRRLQARGDSNAYPAPKSNG